MSNSCEQNPGIKRQAIVLETNKNLALVKIDDFSACNSCPMTGCATEKDQEKPVWAVNHLGATEKDRVLISQSARGYIMSAILMFILPVIILILGVIALNKFMPEKLALFIAVAGSLLYYALAAFFKLFEKATARWAYKIEMVLPKNETFAGKNSPNL
ncbi:MAG: SoxR reducing system RseC family protein [Candidatus Zixiibacteriota bacterium]